MKSLLIKTIAFLATPFFYTMLISPVNAGSFSPDKQSLDFGTCKYNLDTKYCESNNDTKNVRYTNIHDTDYSDDIVTKIGIHNTGYIYGDVFYVMDGDGKYKADRTFNYSTTINKGDSRSNLVMFKPSSSAVKSYCTDKGEEECEFKATIHIQPYYCKVDGEGKRFDCNVESGITVSAKGKVQILLPKPSINTSSVDFGTVSVGQTVEKKIKISNSGDFYYKLIGYKSGDFEFGHTGNSYSIYPGESKEIRVAFTPSSKGSKTTSLALIPQLVPGTYKNKVMLTLNTTGSGKDESNEEEDKNQNQETPNNIGGQTANPNQGINNNEETSNNQDNNNSSDNQNNTQSNNANTSNEGQSSNNSTAQNDTNSTSDSNSTNKSEDQDSKDKKENEDNEKNDGNKEKEGSKEKTKTEEDKKVTNNFISSVFKKDKKEDSNIESNPQNGEVLAFENTNKESAPEPQAKSSKGKFLVLFGLALCSGLGAFFYKRLRR